MTTKTKRDPNGAPIVGRSHGPMLGVAQYTEGGKSMQLSVAGGLHYIKGNKAPCFSVTATLYENRRDVAGGCMHEDVLRHFPDLADLVALHLSSIDGAPMYGVENGFYHLAGAVPGAFGKQYHAGNSERHFPKAEIDPAKPWSTTDYRFPTHEEALQSFADYVRVPIEEARDIRARVVAVYDAEYEALGPDFFASAPGHTSRGMASKAAKAEWVRIGETMRPRWAREAQACIAAHDLVIYGDGGLRAPDTWKGV